MDSEKSAILQYGDVEKPDLARPRERRHSSRRNSRIFYRLCFAAVTILTLWKLGSFLPSCLTNVVPKSQRQGVKIPSNSSVAQDNGRKVALEAHVMSKCPDAKACLQALVVPAMEQIYDKVDFRLSFIGRFDIHLFVHDGYADNQLSVDPDSDHINCMHGPQECLGNMILLCAAQLYPDPKLSLGFANCLIDEYQEIPERDLVETCAMEHGLDFDKINRCLSEEGHALDLLRESVQRSTDAKVSTSCTIRLEEKMWCVTDSEKNCNDAKNLESLVEDIKTAYEESNS